MDIRCGSCNKLFRVADEKVTGKGIRFKCSRCGEVITVTRDEAAAPPVAPPKAPAAASTVVLPPADLSDAQPQPASPSPEFQPQEYQPPAPSAGLDDFDFSEPHAAAAAGAGQENPAGAEGFSFDSPEAGAQESGGGGEISISEEEAKESEAAFQFPADVISEPAKKPAFAGGAALSGAEEEPSAEQQPAPELHFGEQEAEDSQAIKGKKPAGAAKPSPRASVQEAPHQGEEGDIDLGQALAVPQNVMPEKKGPKAAPKKISSASMPEMPDLDDTAGSTAASSESIHPLASGNATGALAGLGCALPIVLLAFFAFSLTARIVPFFASLPRYHLLAVMGTGLVGLGVMTGIVIAMVQAQAGKKLFFLLNVLIGAGFGMVYGAGMNTVTALASGGGLKLIGMISGAVSGGILAFLLSLLISIARRIMLFTRDESFAAPLTGAQKAGMALSLIVILASLYAEGTLIGSLEKAGREIRQQVAEDITAEGVSAENVQGYVDPATGDLVVTGTVRNSLEKPKNAWYLEVDVFDKDQKVLATIKMLNGVQLFDKRDFDILGKRGKNIDELKARMLLAFQGGMIPPKGNVNFEMHLMEPPQGIASIYPSLKKFSLRETGSVASGAQ